MAEVSALIEGGKATAGAPLGPALGPLGVNIGEIVAKINEKTKSYAGIKVPVTLEIHKDKTYDIIVGSPPTSALILKELNVQKGGANQKTDVAGNLSMEQVKKLAEMKIGSLTSTDVKQASREIIGTCNSMSITIEGLRAGEMQKEFSEGKWDSYFSGGAKPESNVQKDLENLGEEIKETAHDVKEEVQEIVGKVAEKAQEAIADVTETIKEEIHQVTTPKEDKPGKEAEEANQPQETKEPDQPKEEKKEEVKETPEKIQEQKQVPQKELEKAEDVEEQAEALEEEVKEKPKGPETQEAKTEPSQKEEPKKPKESYSQHMQKMEKESGVSKSLDISTTPDKPKKNIETEIVKSDSNTEITKPKKKKE